MSTAEQRIPRIDGKEYGGDQAWFKEEIQRGDGCGVIACANLFYGYRYPSGSTPKRKEYMQIAEEMYGYLKPVHLWNPFSPVDSYGLPFFKRTLERTGRFLLSHGIACEAEFFRGRRRTITSFIGRSLRKGDPVLFFTAGSPKKSPFNNHYVLVTGLEGDRLIVCTWGQRLELSLHKLLRDALYVRLGRLKEM